MRRNTFRRIGTTSNCPSDSIQLGLLQARSIYPPAQYCVELLQWSHWRRGGNSWPSLESKLKRQISVARRPSLAAQSHEQLVMMPAAR